MPPGALSPPPAEKRVMTADEFWDFVHLEENEDRDFELIRGEVVEMSRPNRKHGLICTRISRLLDQWAGSVQKGYVASNDSGVILEYDPDTVTGPDVAYYTDAESIEEVPEKWGEVAPVLAVEVLSPNDRPGHVNAKIDSYLESGSQLVWIVDPEQKSVVIHRPGRKPETLSENEVLDGGLILQGFYCPVSDLFSIRKS